MKKLLLILLFLPMIGFGQSKQEESDNYSTKAWEMVENYDFERAIYYFTKAIDLTPEDAYLFRGRASMRFLKKDLDGALSDYNKSIELDNTVSEAYVNRGLLKKTQGYYKDALADYNSAIKLDNSDPDIYLKRAIIYNYLEDYSAAISDLNRSISLNKINPNAYYLRGNMRAKMTLYEKAIDDYTDALDLIYSIIPDKIEHDFSSSNKEGLSETLKDLYQNRASSWNKLEQYENAISDYEKLLELNDIFKEDNAMVYQNLAMCKVNLRDWEGALQAAKKSVKLGNKKADEMVRIIEDFLNKSK